MALQELCNYKRITELANTPDYFKSVVNLLGSIAPWIDLCIHFGFSGPNYNNSTVVIMLTVSGKTTDVVVASMGDHMIIMLDIDTLVRDLCPAQAEQLAV